MHFFNLKRQHQFYRFHVDKMSSAHVYLRLNKNQTIDDISEGLLEDCAQLVKANSIQGNTWGKNDLKVPEVLFIFRQLL